MISQLSPFPILRDGLVLLKETLCLTIHTIVPSIHVCQKLG